VALLRAADKRPTAPVRVDELGHHDARLVAQRLQFAGQLVRYREGFHADQALRQLRHEFEQRAAADGLAQHGLGLAVGVDAMHTEDVLGQIDTDGGDLSHDGLL
jgi:hypothetical protein